MSSDTGDASGAVDADSATEAFALDSNMDADSYLDGTERACPDHETVLPVALPYAYEPDADEPRGYQLVCPHCRYTFDEYEVSTQQWMSR